MSLILDLIFPRNCLLCGKNGRYFCPKCFSLQKTNPVKHLIHSKKEGSLSLFRYENIVKIAILELKYKFVTDLATQLVNLSVHQIKTNFPHILKYWQENNFVLVPIPLFSSRQNWRGFNQSILLGKILAKKLKLNFSDQILFRTKYTHTQAKIKNHTQRIANLQNAFVVNQKIPPNIILFDDVASSFSTLNSAFNSLKCDDLNRCWYLTLAG